METKEQFPPYKKDEAPNEAPKAKEEMPAHENKGGEPTIENTRENALKFLEEAIIDNDAYCPTCDAKKILEARNMFLQYGKNSEMDKLLGERRILGAYGKMQDHSHLQFDVEDNERAYADVAEFIIQNMVKIIGYASKKENPRDYEDYDIEEYNIEEMSEEEKATFKYEIIADMKKEGVVNKKIFGNEHGGAGVVLQDNDGTRMTSWINFGFYTKKLYFNLDFQMAWTLQEKDNRGRVNFEKGVELLSYLKQKGYAPSLNSANKDSVLV